MRISTLCNMCYIVVSRELLLCVFLQKLLHYLNKFTNRHRAVDAGLSATAELLVYVYLL